MNAYYRYELILNGKRDGANDVNRGKFAVNTGIPKQMKWEKIALTITITLLPEQMAANLYKMGVSRNNKKETVHKLKK